VTVLARGRSRERPRANQSQVGERFDLVPDAAAIASQYGQPVIMHLLRRRFGDLLVVALAIAAVVEIRVSVLPGSKPAYAAAATAWTLVLLLRHWLPLLAPVATTTGIAVASFFIADQLQTTATGVVLVLVTAFFAGLNNERRRAIVGLAAMYAGAQVTTVHFSDKVYIGDVVFTTLLVAAPWAAAQVVRSRRARVVELRRRAAELVTERTAQANAAIAEERTRIARELHDVIAHSISVMTIQAGAARLLVDNEPGRAEEALARVEDTGHETLGEMRRLLGVLRQDRPDGDGLEPRPSLDHVEALLTPYRQAGLDVRLVIEGTRRALPSGVDLAAYRIVQEALTNTLKHAGRACVSVRIGYERGRLELEIADDGKAPTTANGSGGGHGLVGMRERTAIYGGSLEAGPRAEGGFAVSARLPIEEETP
jgi:signal transduction histidine kinase